MLDDGLRCVVGEDGACGIYTTALFVRELVFVAMYCDASEWRRRRLLLFSTHPIDEATIPLSCNCQPKSIMMRDTSTQNRVVPRPGLPGICLLVITQ